MDRISSKIKELRLFLEQINRDEFKDSLRNYKEDSEEYKELHLLNSVIEKYYFKTSLLEEKIIEYNDIILKYAQHNYSNQTNLDSNNELLNSLGLSIHLLGEELNFSTVTTYYLDDIFNSMKDLLIVFDKQGFIHSVNNACSAVLKYSKEELIKNPISFILDEQIDFEKLINKDLSGSTYYLISKESIKIPVIFSVSNFVRGDEKEIGTVLIAKDITAKLKAEEELHKSEKKFRSLIENSADIITLIDEKGTVLYVSPSFCRLMGIEEKKRIGKSTFELIHPDDKNEILQLFNRNIQNYINITLPPFRLRHGDGSWRWIEGVASNLLNEPGVNAIVINYRDITDRKIAEVKLKESESKFRKIYENGPLGMVIVDSSYFFILANNTFCQMLGYEEEELKNLTFKDITHPDFISEDLKNTKKLINGEITVYKTEKIYIRKDKQVIWGSLTVTANFTDEGNFLYLVALIEDISERKKAEEDLRFYSYAFSSTKDAIIISDLDFKIKSLNPSAEAIYGWKTDEIKGHLVTDFIKQDYLGINREYIVKQFFENGFWSGEVVQTKRDGSKIIVLSVVSLIKDLKEKPIGVMAVHRDISDIKRTEAHLRVVLSRNEAILDSVPDIITEVNNDKVYTWTNNEGYLFFGNDIIGKEASYFFAGEQNTYEIVNPLFTGEKDLIYVETWQRRRDGEKRLLAWWCRTMRDERGNVEGVLSSAQDITERKHAEEKIIKANRVYAVISQISQAIVRCRNKEMLLKEVCDIAIKYGNFLLTWVGIVNEKTKIVEPIAFAGKENGYLSRIKKISINDEPEGRGPTGSAIREGKYFLCNDIEHDPNMKIWAKEALKHEFHSSIALPLKLYGKIIGSFNLYSSTPYFFDQQEIDLLVEVTNDISFALEAIETEKKRQETLSALRESQHNLKKAQEIAKLGSWIYDFKNNNFFWSDEMTRIFGISVENITLNLDYFLQFIHPEDVQIVKQWMKTCLVEENNDEIVYRANLPNKSLIFLSSRCQHLFDEKGNLEYLSGTVLDITDRKLSEQAIKESEKKYRLITDNINDLVWVMDLKLNSVFVSPSVRKLLGYTVEERLAIPTKKILTPSSYKKVTRLVKNLVNKIEKGFVFDKNHTVNVEIEQVRKDGSTFWAETNVGTYYNDNGIIVGIQGVTRDITERKKAEQILREKEGKFRLMLENLPIPVGAYNIISNKIIFFNTRFTQLFGYSQKDFKTLNEWFDVSLPNKTESTKIKNIWEAALHIFKNKNTVHNSIIEMTVICKDKTVKNVEVYFTVDKNTVYIVFNDITERTHLLSDLKKRINKRTRDLAIANEQLHQELNERKKQEIKLLYSENLNNTTINAINDYIFVVDDNLKIIMYNDVVKQYVKLNRMYRKGNDFNIIGERIDSVFKEFDAAIFKRYNDILEKHIGFTESIEIVRNNKIIYLEIKTIPLISDGKVFQIVTYAHDITKLKQVEEEIKLNLQREKELNMLKTRFISVVSHEFRNPLASISSSIQLIEKYGNKLEEEKIQALFSGIFQTIRYSELLLDDLSIIGKQESGKLELNISECDLKLVCMQSIDDTIATYGGESSRIEFTIHPELKFLYVDKSLLRHILNNVLSNAIKYSEANEPVIFDVDLNNKNIVFTIKDHGRGIPEKDIKFIFEPFQRASNVQSIKGTGLGLAIVKRCVEIHNGNIQLSSKLSKGTTVVIKIPYETEVSV